MNTRENRKPGFALPTLLMITSILLLVATAVAQIGFTSMRVSVQDRDADQALFAAEAGLVAAAEEVTRSKDLTEPFEAELPNGSRYKVVYYKNETTDPMVTVKNIEIPPGTALLHAQGISQGGRTRDSGILLKVGNGVFRVGALGEQFNLANSTFDSFSSDEGAYPGSILSDAMIAASNATDDPSGSIYDVSSSVVNGGIFVGAGADPSALISSDGASEIARQGSLAEPIEVEDIVVPDVDNADVEGEEGDGDDTYSTGDFTIARSGSSITLDLNVPSGFHMTIDADGEVYVDNNGGAEIATGNLMTDEFATINQPIDLDQPARMSFTGDGGFYYQSRDLERSVFLHADGTVFIADGGMPIEGTVPWMADGSGVPSVTNPESLEAGRYESVTVNTGETELLGSTTIVTENLNVSSGGTLALPPGEDSVNIYVTGSLSLDGQDAVVNNTRKAPKLNIYYLGTDSINLSGGSKAYFTLFAPDADLQLTGDPSFPTEFFGALVGKNIEVQNANFHFDQATLGIGQGISGENFRILARPRF